MNIKISDIAKMIDHSLLHPSLTDKEMEDGCQLALKYDVASVCIKPYAVSLAKNILQGSSVAVGTVVGFPHGNSHVSIKCQEAEIALSEGATELDMVVNIGKVIGRDWGYTKKEIQALVEISHAKRAILKVIFENDFLTDNQLKIKLCKICSEIKVDYVKTSTGFGFTKQPNGFYNYQGATIDDVKLMRQHCPAAVKIKAAGGVRTLDELLKFRVLGVDRVGATATKAILDEAKKRFNA